MNELQDCEIVGRFLGPTDTDAFDAVFRLFSPQLVAYFRSRGFEYSTAEDLSLDVMLAAYRKAGQLREHKLFREWLFTVARDAACQYFAQHTREASTLDVNDISEFLPDPCCNPFAWASEFNDWMLFSGRAGARGDDPSLCRGVGIP
jgi:DNA-directed RNA polymerase specialized sigma24 family protein